MVREVRGGCRRVWGGEGGRGGARSWRGVRGGVARLARGLTNAPPSTAPLQSGFWENLKTTFPTIYEECVEAMVKYCKPSIGTGGKENIVQWPDLNVRHVGEQKHKEMEREFHKSSEMAKKKAAEKEKGKGKEGEASPPRGRQVHG